MLMPHSPRHMEWQTSARVPKLGYRKALPEDEAEKLKSQTRETASRTSNLSRKESSHASVRSLAPSSIAVTPKKKSSFFGDLFTKEPTIAALAEVEIDLKSKYGAATPRNVPHVSATKMPEHVPKVNSKWDGVPEAVRARDHEEKQRKRDVQRDRVVVSSQYVRSHSTDGSRRRERNRLGKALGNVSDTASQTGSWQSHDDKVPRHRGPNSIRSTFSEDSQIAGTRQAPSVRSQSLRSPSGTSLPEITSFFPHHGLQHVPIVPQRWQSINSTNTQSTASSDQSRSDTSPRDRYGPPIDAIPEHSASPLDTPGEPSPLTPGYASDRAASPAKGSSESYAMNARAAKHPVRVIPVPIDAFLAGEAQPVNFDTSPPMKNTDLPLRRYQQVLVDRVEPDIATRPDSSRARLGLRASMLVASDAAPWDLQGQPPPVPNSQGTAGKKRLPKALALFK